MIKYSIIIPTCHKDLTRQCLEYISRLNKPEYEYEVLVVHNVSPDNIKEVVNEFQDKIPNLRYIYEENYGQMNSRHRGAKEARGGILCFLDDDSFVDTNWLKAIETTFKNSSIALVGGNNLPFYEVSPPKWLKYFWTDTPYGKYMGELSLIQFKTKNMRIPAWFVFGCNFNIVKNVFFELGGTNPDVVPKDKQRFQGDGETALSFKLNNAGYVAYFNSAIKINHFVSKERMTIEYFKKRAFYQGVADSYSKIRKEHGFHYYHFALNQNDKIKSNLLKRIYNRIANSRLKKIYNFLNIAYRASLEIKSEYAASYSEGFTFHQDEVKNDAELLKWVLKENYLD
jgi:glycosyltransferase involved in cell wall biosynthesis